MGLKEDWKVVKKNLSYLRYIAVGNKEDNEQNWPSDIGFKERGFLSSIFSGIKLATIGDKLTSDVSLKDIYYINNYRHPEVDEGKEKWVFINGICTDRVSAYNNGLALNKIFKRPIYVFHNPTHGFIRDIKECVFERTYDRYSVISTSILRHLLVYLKNGQRIRLIGHSQGGIICSAIVKKMNSLDINQHLEEGQFEVFTIAGAQDEFIRIPTMFTEHFANEKDFVARVGCMHNVDNVDGEVYVREGATGHLLNDHYLEGLIRGDYCDGKSKLYAYANKEKWMADFELCERSVEKTLEMLTKKKQGYIALLERMEKAGDCSDALTLSVKSKISSVNAAINYGEKFKK